MVDINLFDENDDEQSENDDWGDTPSELSDLEPGIKDSDGTDPFGGDDEINFGEDLSGPAKKAEDSFLDDEDAIPDFDEPEEDLQDDNYSFGETKKSGSSKSLILLVLLLIVLGGAAYYQFVWAPSKSKTKKPVHKITQVKSPVVIPKATDTTAVQPGGSSAPKASTASGLDAKPTQAAAAQSQQQVAPLPAGSQNSIASTINATKTLLARLADQNQFGIVLIEKQQFMIQYVSDQPGRSKAIGEEIKTLLNADSYTIAPEDQHRTGDQIYYWGVVTGKLPNTIIERPVTATGVSNLDALLSQIQAKATQNNLIARDMQKFPQLFYNGERRYPGRLVVEGSKANILAFLNQLQTIPGGWGISKIMMAPQKISDFAASELKVELKVWIREQ